MTAHHVYVAGLALAALTGAISVLAFCLNDELVGVPGGVGLLSLILLSGDPGEVFPYVLAEVAAGALTGYVWWVLLRRSRDR